MTNEGLGLARVVSTDGFRGSGVQIGDVRIMTDCTKESCEYAAGLINSEIQKHFVPVEVAQGMVEALQKAKREHLVVDGDCWFSCPASGQCCRDDGGTKCNCGADKINAEIDSALSAYQNRGRGSNAADKV